MFVNIPKEPHWTSDVSQMNQINALQIGHRKRSSLLFTG